MALRTPGDHLDPPDPAHRAYAHHARAREERPEHGAMLVAPHPGTGSQRETAGLERSRSVAAASLTRTRSGTRVSAVRPSTVVTR